VRLRGVARASGRQIALSTARMLKENVCCSSSLIFRNVILKAITMKCHNLRGERERELSFVRMYVHDCEISENGLTAPFYLARYCVCVGRSGMDCPGVEYCAATTTKAAVGSVPTADL
jgi:hypothetical protein